MDALRLTNVVRALTAALGLVLCAATASAQTWPMQNGSHDVLHSFQNPFHFFSYFHEGVDIRGNLDEVVAVRAGTVRYVSQGDAGGTLLVEVNTPSGIECDSYLHVLLDPWSPGDPIAEGDVVGLVANNYFSQNNQHHVHVNRFDGYAGGNGYVNGRGNMLHPLAIFAAAGDLDPQVLVAAPQDANQDGAIFEIVKSGNNGVVLPFAFGMVDLLLEATDRQTSTLAWNQGLMSIGYWIEALSPGPDVQSAATPYMLARFDDAWRGSVANADSIVSNVLVSNSAHVVEFGPDNTQWTSLATYRLTNATGTAGTADDVRYNEGWRTGGKAGTATKPNGTDGLPADEVHEAMFPDGWYRVHALTGDLFRELDTTYDVMVDNFRPYVDQVEVTIGGDALYSGGWTYDEGNAEVTFAAVQARRIGGPADLELTITFTEPMATAEVVATVPDLGFVPTLSSDEPVNGRLTWTGTIPARELRRLRAGRSLRLVLAGTDLNGSTLHPFADTSPVAVPFAKRTDETPWDDATTDALHVLTLPDLGAYPPDLQDGGTR